MILKLKQMRFGKLNNATISAITFTKMQKKNKNWQLQSDGEKERERERERDGVWKEIGRPQMNI